MMIEPREPLYDWGQRVVALIDMINDGSYPDKPDGCLLVECGSEGEIVQVGRHEEANQPVYMIDFDGLIVGCLEEEVMLSRELEQMVAEARGQQRLQLGAA